METNYKEYLEFAKSIAYAAGDIMLKYFNRRDISKYKTARHDASDIVTLADTEINSFLIEQVKQKYPSHSVDGEEEQYGKSNYVWVCDPVDGTAQFARGIPLSTFSLALVIEGSPVVGVVYDPFSKDLFFAAKDYGAYKNDISYKLQVNNDILGSRRTLCAYEYFNTEVFDIWSAISTLKNKATWVCFVSVIRACMAVAEGYYCSVVFPGTEHKNCDIAAAKIIVEEAGGIVRNFYGSEDRMDGDIKGAVISNKAAYDEVQRTLQETLCLK